MQNTNNCTEHSGICRGVKSLESRTAQCESDIRGLHEKLNKMYFWIIATLGGVVANLAMQIINGG